MLGLLLSNFFFPEQFSQYKLHPQLLFSPESSESHSEKPLGWGQLGPEPGGLSQCRLVTLVSVYPAAAAKVQPCAEVTGKGRAVSAPSHFTMGSGYLCCTALACARRQEENVAQSKTA